MPSFVPLEETDDEEVAVRPFRLSALGLSASDAVLLAIPAFWAPARLLSHNFAGIPHLERHLFIFLVLWVLGLAMAALAIRAGVSPRAAVHTTFVVVAALVSGGSLMRQLGSLVGWAVLVVLVVVVGVLTHRMEDSFILRAVVIGVAVAMLAGPLVSTFRTAAAYGPDTTDLPGSVDLELSARPDIWFVVLDGYPGRLAMTATHGVAEDEQMLARLDASGFIVPRSAWTSYPNTKLSVPSMMEMGYPAEDWIDNGATTQTLYNVISGDNNLVDVLQRNGYETYMVESGWSGSSCGSSYDHCVAAPYYDAGMNFVAYNSVVGDQPFVRPGVALALGAQHTMEWLADGVGVVRNDNHPSFVFAHLVAPHPPFFLDESCDMVIERDRDGFFFPFPDVDLEHRERYFAEQLACVDSFVEQFVDLIGADDVIVLTADHGTGRAAQMGTDPEEWTESAVRERMNPFVAVRFPGECAIDDPLVLPNLMRNVLSCLSEESLGDVPERIFIGPNTELSPDLRQGLLTSGL
ncbi:MAG: sulfatase-like hydrolase/transferase [Acidimicrobiia bacterium]|jgi:hypothetical protein